MKTWKDIPTVDSLDVKNKVVFLRLDLNVPLKDGNVLDTTRIDAALPTIKYLIDAGAKVVMASHLGRPKSPDDTKYSLEPVAQVLSTLLEKEVVLVEAPKSSALGLLIKTQTGNQVLLLENLRFDSGEKDNSPKLAMFWSKYCDVYINDAFGACHRDHASIVALPGMIPQKAAGFLIVKELESLSSLTDDVASPFTMIIGGAKVSDKIEVIEAFVDRVDNFIIGGAMAYTFLKAKNVSVGKSLVEEGKVRFAKKLIERIETRGKKIHLPVDHLITNSFDSDQSEVTAGESIPSGKMALDIGPKTIEAFSKVISESKMILWNGPMGVYEKKPFDQGTNGIALAIAQSDAQAIVGGGDSAAAAKSSGHSGEFFHISTGGGASLEFLEGKPLPGITALLK